MFRMIINSLFLLTSFSLCSIVDALTESATIAAIQLTTADAGNFSKMQELVRQAKSQGAELVIFPEESVFSWLNPNVFLEAAPIPGSYSDKFAAIAKAESIWLAAGLGEQGPEAGPGSQKGAHQAYNSGILINPEGQIVLHHRQLNVVRNSFDPCKCKEILNQNQCSYTPGDFADITTITTPFGKTSILVCADAYTYPPAQVLDAFKQLQPDFIIIFWGIGAATQSECGNEGFNASDYAEKAASYLNGAFVVGSNALGARCHGRFLPSVYCGGSGCSTPSGYSTETIPLSEEIIFFYLKEMGL